MSGRYLHSCNSVFSSTRRNFQFVCPFKKKKIILIVFLLHQNKKKRRCNSTSYVIHGLAPLRTYQFRVRAKNIHGSSDPSSPSDPLFLQPPMVVEKRDKAVVVDHHHREKEKNKDHDVSLDGQTADDDHLDYDQDDEDESHASQFEHCLVTVQPGEPHFLVGSNYIIYFYLKTNKREMMGILLFIFQRKSTRFTKSWVKDVSESFTGWLIGPAALSGQLNT